MPFRCLIAVCLGLLIALLSPTVLAGPAPDWYFGYTTRDGRTTYTTDCAEAVNASIHGCRAPLPDPVIESLTVYPEWRQCQYVIRPGCLNGDTWENGVLNQTFGCGNAAQLPDGTCDAPVPQRNLGNVCQDGIKGKGLQCGEPISVATGNEYTTDTDYTANGPFTLRFDRHYNSLGVISAIGARWTHTYSRAVVVAPDGAHAMVYHADGRGMPYLLSNGSWVGDAGVAEPLIQLPDGSWRYVNDHDETEFFNATGKLVAVTNRAGVTQTLTYDTNGRLIQASDAFGHRLTFSYTGNKPLHHRHERPCGRTISVYL